MNENENKKKTIEITEELLIEILTQLDLTSQQLSNIDFDKYPGLFKYKTGEVELEEKQINEKNTKKLELYKKSLK